MPALSRPLSRWAAIAATLVLVALLPATASATGPVNDPPIAVDDPGIECGYQGLPGDPPPFGGAYPVAEDYRGEARQPTITSTSADHSRTTATRTATR